MLFPAQKKNGLKNFFTPFFRSRLANTVTIEATYLQFRQSFSIQHTEEVFY